MRFPPFCFGPTFPSLILFIIRKEHKSDSEISSSILRETSTGRDTKTEPSGSSSPSSSSLASVQEELQAMKVEYDQMKVEYAQMRDRISEIETLKVEYAQMREGMSQMKTIFEDKLWIANSTSTILIQQLNNLRHLCAAHFPFIFIFFGFNFGNFFQEL